MLSVSMRERHKKFRVVGREKKARKTETYLYLAY